MVILDQYQIDFINNIRVDLKKKRRIIACAATGAGKSKVFIDITHKAIKKGKTVLIITESKKIFDQIISELPAVCIDPKSKHIFLPRNGIYVAMAQTLSKREELVKQLIGLGDELLTICDECHIGTFNTLLSQLSNCWLIGFSATPDARWAKHLPVFYKGIVIGPQPEELIQLGFLAPYKHFARVGADLDLLSLHNGDFTEASQELAFGNNKVFEGLIEDLTTIKYRKCLIFTASIHDCDLVYDQLSKSGFKCVAVHRSMKESEFSYSLGQFKNEESGIDICISVGTLTKGFDFAAIDLIVLRRATTSLPLFLQMIGRGSRARGVPWKKFFTVLDYGANYLRHGMWDMERDWNELWNKPKRAKEGIAPIKLCPHCEFISPAGATECPNCGHQFVKKDLPLELGKLIEITERYNSIRGKSASQLTAEELSIYAKLKGKRNFAARIAHARDQDNPGFLGEYAEHMQYKKGWVEFRKKSAVGENGEVEKVQYPDFILV